MIFYKNDIVKLILMYLCSIIVIYFLSGTISFLFLLTLLIIFFYSENYTFWLIFIFIVESSPGAIFSNADPVHSFSLLSGSAFGNLYFWIIFILIAIHKTRNDLVNYPIYFLNNILFAIGIYFLILILSNGVYKWSAIIRLTLPWLLLYLIPRMLQNEESYANFFKLVFVFVPFVLITQFYKLATANEFVTLLGGIGNEAILATKDVFESGSALRPVDGIYIPFLSLLGTTFFLTYGNQKYFSKNYLLLISAFSLFSIFLTATRSWLISTIFVLITYSLINLNAPIRNIIRYSLVIIVLGLLVTAIPAIYKQTELAFERYETIGQLVGGDVTAGGTLKRFDVRSPKVMAKFEEKPIFGWGFGEEGASFSDGHVGHQNLLMHGGIVGYALFFILWVMFISKMITAHKYLKRSSPFCKTPLILVSFFIGIHIINTSVQWFHFLANFTTAFTLAILFSLANMVYWEAYRLPEN